MGLTHTLNLMEAEFQGRLRRVGNSLALLVPAREVERVGLKEGQYVGARLNPAPEEILGFLKRRGVPYEPFVREAERRDRDW